MNGDNLTGNPEQWREKFKGYSKKPIARCIGRTSIGNASDADDIGAFHFYKEKQSSLPAVLRHNS